MKKALLTIFSVVFVSASVGFSWQDDDEKPKYTNKQVMGKIFKGKNALSKKLANGSASDEEKKLAVEYITALSKNKPKKGDIEGWKKKTKALLATTVGIQKGEEGAAKKFVAASNCKNCHKDHK